MPIDKELFDLWREWRRTAKPTENFTSGKRSAVSYALECELDHTVTWIAGLVERVTDGHIDRRLLERIGEEQVDLGRYLANLEEVHITPEVKSRLQTYIRLTQALLSKIEAVCLKNLEHRST